MCAVPHNLESKSPAAPGQSPTGSVCYERNGVKLMHFIWTLDWSIIVVYEQKREKILQCGQLALLRTVVLSKKKKAVRQLLQTDVNFTACLSTCIYGELNVEPNSCFSVLKLNKTGLCNVHISLFWTLKVWKLAFQGGHLQTSQLSCFL